jgi:hypothetical protein
MNHKCWRCLYSCKKDGVLKLKKCRIEELRSKKWEELKRLLVNIQIC